MNEFILYFKMGLYHVLDFLAYDHVLFLVVLTVVFSFNHWKKIIWLITLFTIGHSISLFLSSYNIIKFKTALIEFLIPLTIIITGIINIFTAKNSASGKQNINLLFALFFGLVHGFAFSNYFKSMIGKSENKILPLLEFSLGIEAAQILIALVILITGTILHNFFKVNKRDWILVLSSIVVGFALQMLLNRVFW